MLALRTGAQVVPVGINNTDAVWRKGRPAVAVPAADGTVRIGDPFRVQDVHPRGHRPADRQEPRHDRDHGPHRRAPRAPSPGRLRGGRQTRAHARGVTGTPSPMRARSRHVCDHRTAMGTVQDVRIATAHRVLLRRPRGDRQGEGVGRGRQADPHPRPGRPQRGRRSATSRRSASGASTRSTTSNHGAAVVIRAHGVTPEVMERAEARGLEVIDGTCTWVIQEQRELQELVEEGYTIVLLGTPEASRGRRPARLRARRDRRRRGGGLGPDPAPQADGAHHPVHPAALEVREAGRVHGQPRPRAQDRQHRLPGHDPPPGGHARAAARAWT